MSCPDLILHKCLASNPAQVYSLYLRSLCSWTYFCTSKLHTRVVLCVTRYNLGLYDMNCCSMNGSHTSQGGIPMGGMSQIKTEHFSFNLASAPLSTSLLHQYCFVPIHHPVLGTQLLSTQNGGSTACGAAACSLSANTGNTGCVNMKELYLRLMGGPSVSELIRNRPNKFLKC